MVAQTVVRKILVQNFEEYKKRAPATSLRSFSRSLDISPSALSEIFSGRRRISRSFAARLLSKLDVPEAQRRGVLDLFPSQQGRGKKQVSENYVQLEEDAFQLIADWYHFAILSLLSTRSSSFDLQWIADRLEISLEQATSAVDRLIRLELLVRDPEGHIQVTGRSYRSEDGVSRAAIRENHRQKLALATKSLDRDPIQIRDFNAFTVAISPARIDGARDMIRDFAFRLVRYLEADPKDREEVYQLCIQLFPLSRPVQKK